MEFLTFLMYFKFFIVAFLVCIVLDLLTARSSKKKSSSLDSFVVRAPIDFAILGGIAMAFFLGVFSICEDIGEIETYSLLFTWIVGGMFALCLLLMAAPIQGVWDIVVENDDITVIKGFLYRRHWKFSTICYAKAGRGGLKVYVQGRKRRAFFVDTMLPASQNFIKRMEKEGKPIVYQHKDQAEQIKE